MANIMDYLEWRGDLTLESAPFNVVDNLIFAELSFIDFFGIVPSDIRDGTISLADAAERFFADRRDEKPMGLIVPQEIITMLKIMAACPRYRDLQLTAFVSHTDVDMQKQFAALTVLLNKREMYVAFRGTDDTLVGWKENFNMGVRQAVPSQIEAVEYTNRVAKNARYRRVYIGGHSKGGNLAVYAAAHCDKRIKSRIVSVYSNDGPGFRLEVVRSEAYRSIEKKIVNIIPQSSIVGRLLENNNRYTVVQSSAAGLWQHDGFSWQISGASFVEAGELSKESEMIDKSLKKWLAEMDDEKRERFIEALYTVLTATNAQTLTELTKDKGWLWKLLRISDGETKKAVLGALTGLTGEEKRLWTDIIFPFLIARKK